MAELNPTTDIEDVGGEAVYSVPIKAGRRTYFFDVKSTRTSNDYYLIITESRKKLDNNGKVHYEKHKLHLYKEDFAKFSFGLLEAVRFVKEHRPEFFATETSAQELSYAAGSESDKL